MSLCGGVPSLAAPRLAKFLREAAPPAGVRLLFALPAAAPQPASTSGPLGVPASWCILKCRVVAVAIETHAAGSERALASWLAKALARSLTRLAADPAWCRAVVGPLHATHSHLQGHWCAAWPPEDEVEPLVSRLPDWPPPERALAQALLLAQVPDSGLAKRVAAAHATLQRVIQGGWVLLGVPLRLAPSRGGARLALQASWAAAHAATATRTTLRCVFGRQLESGCEGEPPSLAVETSLVGTAVVKAPSLSGDCTHRSAAEDGGCAQESFLLMGGTRCIEASAASWGECAAGPVMASRWAEALQGCCPGLGQSAVAAWLGADAARIHLWDPTREASFVPGRLVVTALSVVPSASARLAASLESLAQAAGLASNPAAPGVRFRGLGAAMSGAALLRQFFACVSLQGDQTLDETEDPSHPLYGKTACEVEALREAARARRRTRERETLPARVKQASLLFTSSLSGTGGRPGVATASAGCIARFKAGRGGADFARASLTMQTAAPVCSQPMASQRASASAPSSELARSAKRGLLARPAKRLCSARQSAAVKGAGKASHEPSACDSGTPLTLATSAAPAPPANQDARPTSPSLSDASVGLSESGGGDDSDSIDLSDDSD